MKLDKILENLTDFEVTDEAYADWKVWYEEQPEHEKVFHLLGALSQYLLDTESKATASVLATAIVCTSRWTSEKDLEDFF